MLKKFNSVILEIYSIIGIILLLIFPLISFKYNINFNVFPVIEVILVYNLSLAKLINSCKIFILSLLVDQLYNFPLGSYALLFLSINFIFNITKTWSIINNYNMNCFMFCVYLSFILFFKYIIMLLLNQRINLTELIYQYIITILIYPTSKAILDSLLRYSRYGVRQQNS